MNDSEQQKRDVYHVAILAALSATIGAYLIANSVLISKDGVFYIEQAQRIADDALSVAKRHPPGYPLLLLAAHRVASFLPGSDSAAFWVLSSQSLTLLCRIAALIVLYFAGKRLVGPRHSFLAVAILTVLPHAAHYGSDVLREWPFLLFIAVGLWLILWAWQEHKWWAFGLVGLAAGAGYLIQPVCNQLVVYGALALLLAERGTRVKLKPAAAGPALAVGFAAVVVPFTIITGEIVPRQLTESPVNRPAVILSVGGRPASDEPIRFVTQEGQPLELAIETFDADDDPLQFSAVMTPVGSRPVYRFRYLVNGTYFWTLLEYERNLLLENYPENAWVYDGIAYYAYAQADDAQGLQPVYRLWSPSRDEHFYTTDRSVQRALLDESPGGLWRNEGVVFYVPAEIRRRVNSVPVYQFAVEGHGHFWSVEQSPRESLENSMAREGIAWYAFAGAALPAGCTLADGVLRWRPTSEQLGAHQFNLVVSDGQFDSCQLVQIDVQSEKDGKQRTEGGGQKTEDTGQRTEDAIVRRPSSVIRHPSSVIHLSGSAAQSVSAKRNGTAMRSLMALGEIARGISDNLMVFFLLPLCLGLVHRWRHRASRQERAFVIAVVAVNMGLMFCRYVWVEPVAVRRYSITLVVLTIFYIPTGLELMAHWLSERWDRTFGKSRRVCNAHHSNHAADGEPCPPYGRLWLYTLTAVGVAICVPKLVQPLSVGKEGYRQVAQWLSENTRPDAAVAVPDSRIAFYADRRGLVYERYADPRRADYIVALLAQGDQGALGYWDKVYSPPGKRGSGTQLVVYRRPAAQTARP